MCLYATLGTCYSVRLTLWYAGWNELWAHSRPKHVEKRNKHTKKNCAPIWLYVQHYTGMHGQQNIKSRIHMYGITITQHCVHDDYKMNRNAE